MNKVLEPGEIIYKVNKRNARKAALLYFILSLVCFLIFFYIYNNPANIGPIILNIAFAGIMATGGLGFAVLGLLFIRRLYSKQPYLLINENGIYDYASGIYTGAGFIDWNIIDDIKLSKYHNLPCVELVIKNREQFLREFSILERVNRSKFLGYPAVALRGPLLPIEPRILFKEIVEYKKLIVKKRSND